MRKRFAVVFLLIALCSQSLTVLSQARPQSGSTQNQATQQPQCTDNGTYQNRKGETVRRPENCSSTPQGATAQCRDKTYSFSSSRRGTCSHHGGVL